MTTLDMTLATQSINMADPNLTEVDRVVERISSEWSWITTDGHDIDLSGSGLTYDANGKATGGTVNLIAIDAGNNNSSRPDILIRNVTADATKLDDGVQSFWNELLAGDDTILGPLVENAGNQSQFQLFGDRELATGTAGAGGNDLFRAGDANVIALGDVVLVAPDAVFQGGDDDIFTAPTALKQVISGDAHSVDFRGKLIGGDDVLVIRSSNEQSLAAGDAIFALSFRDAGGEVVGGNDRITAEDGSRSRLAGDVGTLDESGIVRGGNDTINGGELGELIAGDVFDGDDPAGATVFGGSDLINGNAGNDTIGGDLLLSGLPTSITGGNDTIHGGEGDDFIFGEFVAGDGKPIGGNDQLFGDAGNDSLNGQSGNDILDGGSGADKLQGNEGRDAASYASATTGVVADLINAAVNAGDAAGDTYFSIENIIGSTFADSLRGNNAANVMFGGLGNDVVIGRGGNDRLFGQGGRDGLDGGTGNDVLAGGGGIDTFVFRAGYDADRITDYNDAQDRLDLRSFGFASFAEIAAIAIDTAAGLQLNFGGDDLLIIENFTRANFDAGDVII